MRGGDADAGLFVEPEEAEHGVAVAARDHAHDTAVVVDDRAPGHEGADVGVDLEAEEARRAPGER